jgi:hypothetical protein
MKQPGNSFTAHCTRLGNKQVESEGGNTKNVGMYLRGPNTPLLYHILLTPLAEKTFSNQPKIT